MQRPAVSLGTRLRPGAGLRLAPSRARGFGFPGGSLTFVENAVGAYEYGRMHDLPDGFGDGEFWLRVYFRCLSNATYALGDTSVGGTLQRQRWANANPTRYGNDQWWFYGNFLIDGFVNGAVSNGTFALQIAAGRPRWTFSDGSSGGPGGVWGMQSAATNTVLDNAWHYCDMVRRWTGASSADLELYLDGTLQDTQTTALRTNLATTYWDAWTAYTSAAGWGFGVEKQASLGDISQWEDFKGQLGEMRFYSRVPSAGELAANAPVIGNEAGLVGLYRFGSDVGAVIDNELTPGSSIGRMTLVGSPAWSADRGV